MNYIANNLNVVIVGTIIGLSGISILLHRRYRFVPQWVLLVIAAILLLSGLITRSLADSFVGIIALMLSGGSTLLVVLWNRLQPHKAH
jgi:hypothetical protein